jgi:flagellar basal-body rod protein FlgB
MLNRLTNAMDFQGQALSLRAERQRLIASNIANADTPGYVSRDMNFAQALRNAVGQQGAGVALAAASNGSAGSTLNTTQAGHIGNPGFAPTSTLGSSTLMYSTASQTSLDNNTVDMDRERASFADNAVKYEATLRFITSNSRTMLDAIKGQP